MPRHNRPHEIYMSFLLVDGRWQVQFLLPDLKTSLPLKLIKADLQNIRKLARRGEALRTPESRAMLDHAVQAGSGGVHIRLTRVQYSKLCEPDVKREKS